MVSFQPTDEEQAFFRLAKDFAASCPPVRGSTGPFRHGGT